MLIHDASHGAQPGCRVHLTHKQQAYEIFTTFRNGLDLAVLPHDGPGHYLRVHRALVPVYPGATHFLKRIDGNIL